MKYNYSAIKKYTDGLCLLLCISLSGHARSEQVITPLIALPECSQYQYAIPTPTQSGEKIDGPKGRLFCTKKDFPKNSLQETKLIHLLDEKVGNRKITNVYLSAYIYSEANFADWLCSKELAVNASITILAQQNNDGSGRVSPEFARALSKCPATIHYLYFGCEVFSSDENNKPSTFDCPKGRINVLHLKTLQVGLDDGREIVLLGSGNYNRSLYANVEDWIVYEGVLAGQKYPVAARCIFESAMHNSNKSPSANDLNRNWSVCMSEWGELSESDGVTLEFAPFQGDQYKERLKTALRASEKIYIAAQSLEDPEIIDSILSNPIADKRIIVDDDWYWAQKKKADFYTASYEKTKWINQLSRDQLRFLQTNHTALGGVGGTLHTRLIITETSGASTVFTGSAHIRKGSYELNVEHLLTISNEDLSKYYRSAFDELWSRSLPESKMPIVDTPIILDQSQGQEE